MHGFGAIWKKKEQRILRLTFHISYALQPRMPLPGILLCLPLLSNQLSNCTLLQPNAFLTFLLVLLLANGFGSLCFGFNTPNLSNIALTTPFPLPPLPSAAPNTDAAILIAMRTQFEVFVFAVLARSVDADLLDGAPIQQH